MEFSKVFSITFKVWVSLLILNGVLYGAFVFVWDVKSRMKMMEKHHLEIVSDSSAVKDSIIDVDSVIRIIHNRNR